MTNETVALIANVALALSFIVALVFGIAQVKAAGRDRREQLTLEALRSVQTREFAEYIYYLNTRPIPEGRKEWDSLSEPERIMFIQFGQQMESLGFLVAEKIIDIDLVYKILGFFVTTNWKRVKPVIMVQREHNPFIGEYFQWLAEAIEKQMREHPRKPVYQN